MATATKAAPAPEPIPTETAVDALLAHLNWNRAAIVTSNKGGPGKSFTAKTLAHVFRDAGAETELWDGDETGSSLSSAYALRDDKGKVIRPQDPLKGVGQYSISERESARTLTETFSSKSHIVLHDMKGGALESMMNILDDGDSVEGFLDMADKHKRRLTFIHVVNDDEAATISVGIYLDLFGDRADHLVVINQRLGKGETKFPFWYGFMRPDGVKQGGAARQQLGEMYGFDDEGNPKHEILLPALDIGLNAKLNSYKLPFAVAAEHPWFTSTEQSMIQNYLKQATKAFAPHIKLLGL
jgi:hypothetical protein